MSELNHYNETMKRIGLKRAHGILKRRQKGETLQEIGDSLGISRERVRQLEQKAKDS
jgi:DNA-directed RNA polymerase sigma subunit (sigma70/sigma32)